MKKNQIRHVSMTLTGLFRFLELLQEFCSRPMHCSYRYGFIYSRTEKEKTEGRKKKFIDFFLTYLN